jgi:hypothetical protein
VISCSRRRRSATAERQAELRIEAARRARLSPLYIDLAVSLSKSISVFHVSPGENARLAGLAGRHGRGGGGDMIVCTKNDYSILAGKPGRTLANGDLLRIEEITEDGISVRWALDVDPRTRGAAVD